MSMRKKVCAVTLILALLLGFSASMASAVSTEEFLPELFKTLGRQNPQKLTSAAPEQQMTGRSAVLLSLEAMGWDFEVNMYEQLTLLPELSERDALESIAAKMSPPVPAAVIKQFNEPLAKENMPLLMEWLAKCKKGVEWQASFDYEGTTLTLYKRGVGTPGGPSGGDPEKGVNEPLYVAMLTVDMARVPCEIATAVMAGGKRLELARIAEENYGVIGGVNGGYFAGAKPIGTLRRQGFTENAKFWPYRSAFGWNDCGEFVFIDGKEVSQIEGNRNFDKYTEILQAGPLLIKNGANSPNTENIHTNVISRRHPRTVVGTDGSKVMWAVVDGRSSMHSVGATMDETRALCKKLGMRTALNLDGGGSSSIWWRGMTFSLPSNARDAERPIPYAVLMFLEGHGVRR